MKLLILGGPTATGKTDAAIEVRKRWGAEIISADAMQVYRGMDIGTAKPEPEVLERWPHHLVDIREPDQDYSAADFAADADAIIERSERVVVAGGTGFYVRALLKGLAPAPPGDPELRAELERLEDPHGELERVDPELAARLHPNDRVRVIRGLEVHRLTGEPLSKIHARHDLSQPRHAAVRLMLDREDLYERIDWRVERMMEAGYLEEVRGLLAAGHGRDVKPMKSLGYKWLAAHLSGEIELEEAVSLTQRDTRRFSRKQRNMFRSLGGFVPTSGGDLDGILRAAEQAFGVP